MAICFPTPRIRHAYATVAPTEPAPTIAILLGRSGMEGKLKAKGKRKKAKGKTTSRLTFAFYLLPFALLRRLERPIDVQIVAQLHQARAELGDVRLARDGDDELHLEQRRAGVRRGGEARDEAFDVHVVVVQLARMAVILSCFVDAGGCHLLRHWHG